jgi:signal recognition particle GTPase
MSNVAAQLGNLLGINADINFYTQQSIYWNGLYEANQEKLEKQVSYEQKWESAYDDAQNTDKKCQIGNQVWKDKDQVLSDAQADAYAHAKVRQYDEALSEELAELDIEYDTMKTMYDTLLEELRAQQSTAKQSTSTAAQDTGLLQS